MQNPVPRQHSLVLMLVLVLVLLINTSSGTVKVTQNPKDAFNPTVLVESSRLETSYSGPLHQFEAAYGMHQISLKVELQPGQHQCFYFVLTEGHKFTVMAASTAPDENKFFLLMANSETNFMRTQSDHSNVAVSHNVTESDTYEVCLINSYGTRTILFVATYYQPLRYEAEARDALSRAAIVTNISDATAKYISNIELNIGMALSNIRFKPNLYRDYVIIRDSNTYVQWKSLIFIFIMFCSYGGTTLFIHYLFHVPKGKVVI